MPFIIQQPPPIDVPRTKIEMVQTNTATSNAGGDPPNSAFQILDKDLMADVFLRAKYFSLKNAWEKNTRFSSSLAKITEDVNFRRIVQLGESAVPLIIEDISKKPSNLVWALNAITGMSLTSKIRITVADACKVWVKLYRKGAIKF